MITAVTILAKAMYEQISDYSFLSFPGVRIVHTQTRDVGHVLHGTGQRADEADDESDGGKNHRASSMFCNGVHHDTESQDVRTHDENREEQLAEAEQLTSKRSEQDLASVGQVLDVGVSDTELEDGVSGVGSEKAQSDNENESWGKA